jgi:hypothetical protein
MNCFVDAHKQREGFCILLNQYSRFCAIVIGFLLLPFASVTQNPIVTENLLPGSPSSEWDISGAGDLTIQGFATDISVNKGERVNFKIDVAGGGDYSVKIYRIGYYQGNGARVVANLGTFTGIEQPAPYTEVATGLIDCGNWAISCYWDIPATAVSGIYIAKLTRASNGGASHIVFIVRDDASTSDLYFQTSDATWQAYNAYGGNSLYVGNTSYPSGHATKVSYNRPFVTRNGGGGGGAMEDWLFNAEYPMIRWLERNGYDISYTTNVDIDRRGNLVQQHKIFLSVGHDEYWSAQQYSHVVAARNNGVHLAFFSGNEVYWKTRWENSYDGTNTPHRTLVCYKEGTLGENACGSKCDPLPDVWTGLWRDGCAYPAADGCRPENALTGQISWALSDDGIQVPDTYKNHRFWRNTSIASLGTGQTATLSQGTLGYEWNYEQAQYANSYPNGRITLSSTTVNGRTHKLSLYKHSSGAWVFGAGTVQWSWGLDGNHDRGSSTEDIRVQQATVNLFADMGVQPASIQPGLQPAAASTDSESPVSIISNPLNGATIPANTTITISGTASDNQLVAGVEVSVDGGLSWHIASGTTNWSYSWTVSASGIYTIKCRGFDDSGNMEGETASNVVSITVSGSAPVNFPLSLFAPGSAPATVDANDGQSIELGMKFQSAEAGFITGIRFYKGPGNTGTHTGHLWSSTGTLLASVLFTNETASGWQQANLSSPLAINPNTTYIVSYLSSGGGYSFTDNFFTTATVNGPLKGLANGEDGPNGVYKYSNTAAFPTDTYQSSNYWVDIVFDTTTAPDTNPPSVVSAFPTNGSSAVSINTTVAAIFNESLDAATVNNNTVELRAGATLISTNISYNTASQQIVITPASALSYNTVYTVTLKGGTGYQRIKDLAGNALANDYSWSFTTASAPPPPPNEGPGGPILVISTASNPFSRYTVEILRAQGLNAFTAMDISLVTNSVLNNYDVVLLGEMSLNSAQVGMLSDWTQAGGTLICFRPDAQLSSLLGISPAIGSPLADKYLLVNTASGPGLGIVNQTIQYHGAADLYSLNGASQIATLYSSATTASSYPAVTKIDVGTNGGVAVAFMFDLPRSIVYTRQGNPAWSGQERDGQAGPIRSNDLFYGNASFDPQPDWIDFNKIAIPQADEQMHLLSNIITQYTIDRKPLPRFWFLPSHHKAAIVMTGDDHGNNGTEPRFNQYLALSSSNTQEAIDNWIAIRGSSYIYPNTPISNTTAASFQAQGFEIGVHLNTGCTNWNESSLNNDFNTQLAQMAANFPGLLPTTTHRTHCIAWSDWATQAKLQAQRGIRLDANYYYWPGTWIQDRPGLFTGSGMPMRFGDLDGTIIDCYQVATQLTDESGQNIALHISQLLDKALGAEAYYGVFCANMHTDASSSSGSDAIISAAVSRGVPVISAKQMLTWLDGRNASSFGNIEWNGSKLEFTISVGAGARNLRAMVPFNSSTGQLVSLYHNGNPVATTTEIIKGVSYAFFNAEAGEYEANYSNDITPPIISNVTVVPNANGSAVISWNTNEPATSKISFGTAANALNTDSIRTTLVTTHSITLQGLLPGTVYYYRISSSDGVGNTSSDPIAPNAASFTMPAGTCFEDNSYADFMQGDAGSSTYINPNENGFVSLKPAIVVQFDALPPASEWNSYAWTGGSSTVSSGQLSVNGSRYNNESESNTFGPGTTLEFVASFGAASFQHIGFGGGSNAIGSGGMYNGESPWAMFSTGNTTNTLRARTYISGSNFVDYTIPGSYIGSAHVYKIEWLSTGGFNYYIDGTLVHAENSVLITSPMRIGISDYSNDAIPVLVDWMIASPYPGSGTFTSRVFDAGMNKTWGTTSWTEEVPASTTLQLLARTGNTALPDASWTSFAAITNGGNLSQTSRYIQYRADLSTSNSSITPKLKDIQFSCFDPAGSAPSITLQPISVTRCAGDTIRLVSKAAGEPTPTVQWQLSTDNGNNWADSTGAISDTLILVPQVADNGKQYRAIWTNILGIDTSEVAAITINTKPSATIAAVNANMCQGSGDIQLTLAEASGQSPFHLVINGQSYNNISVGQTIATYRATEISIWGSSGTPANPDGNDGQPIEIGMKFRSTTSGLIKGIRFYKGVTNTGTHIGSLWSSNGTLLATATFVNESASGWQEVRFSNAVSIAANTTYIASYLSQGGGFAISPSFFASSGVTNGPLTALQAGTDGPNGVYRYGGGFPNNGNSANYWVDVIFEEEITSPQVFNYLLTQVSDANGCSNTDDTLSFATVSINPKPAGSITAAASNFCAGSAIELVFTASRGNAPFSLTINDSTYNNISSGIPFNTGIIAAVQNGPFSLWSDTVTGGEPPVLDNSAIEIGVKFRSAVAGQVTGIRFYKRAANTGTHTGSLWSSNGTLLATATFVNETASGWQQVNFSEPVNISPGVTYVASYFAPNGNYAFTANYFTSSGISNGPLSGLQAGVDGSNGVYKYSAGGLFPNESFNNSNYWVDLVFEPAYTGANFILTNIIDASGCTLAGTSLSTAMVNVTGLNLSIDSIAPITCAGDANGYMALSASGINGSSMFSIDSGATYHNNAVFENLAAGRYRVIARASNGCTDSATVIVGLEIARWIGAVSDNWHNPANWSTGKLPGARTHVIIEPGTVNPCVISAGNAYAASIQAKSGAVIQIINSWELFVAGNCAQLPPID